MPFLCFHRFFIKKRIGNFVIFVAWLQFHKYYIYIDEMYIMYIIIYPVTWEWQWNLNTLRFGGGCTPQSSSDMVIGSQGIHITYMPACSASRSFQFMSHILKTYTSYMLHHVYHIWCLHHISPSRPWLATHCGEKRTPVFCGEHPHVYWV